MLWFERSFHPAHVSRQNCPWLLLKLTTSHAVEGTWIHPGGYGQFRGKRVKMQKPFVNDESEERDTQTVLCGYIYPKN